MRRNWLGIATLLAIALAVAAAVWVFFPANASDADIREVWEHHEQYQDQSLRVSGTLKRFLKGQPKEHYVVESPDGYRIGVEAMGLEALEGAQVTAEGKVTFDENRGLRLAEATVTAH